MGEVVTQTPIEVLRREHALARRMVQLLLRLANEVEGAEGFPAADIAEPIGEHPVATDGLVAWLPLTKGRGDAIQLPDQAACPEGGFLGEQLWQIHWKHPKSPWTNCRKRWRQARW